MSLIKKINIHNLNQLDTFCKDIDLSDSATLSKRAFDFYVHLMMEKKGIGEKGK